MYSCKRWVQERLVDLACIAQPQIAEDAARSMAAFLARPSEIAKELFEDAARRSYALDMGLPVPERTVPEGMPKLMRAPVASSLSPSHGAGLWAPWCGVKVDTAMVWAGRSRRYRGQLPTRSAGVSAPVLYILDGLASGKLPLRPPAEISHMGARVLMQALGVTREALTQELGLSPTTIYRATIEPVRLYAAVMLLGSGFPVNPLFRTDWIKT